MDAFGDNFDQADVDPAAEFLAREKDQLAGLEDELAEPVAALSINPATQLSDGKKVSQKIKRSKPLREDTPDWFNIGGVSGGDQPQITQWNASTICVEHSISQQKQ